LAKDDWGQTGDLVILPQSIVPVKQKLHGCRIAVEMSSLNAIEMSAFLLEVEQSFLP
jgi:hypothetical protein